MLEAGATIDGKSVCEDLCFSGRLAHLAHRPGAQPVGPEPLHRRLVLERQRGAGRGRRWSTSPPAATRAARSGCPPPDSGIVGHKPTYGLVPYTGAFPIEQSIDHVGPMTRTVADAALALGVIAGPDGLDPRQPDAIWSPTTTCAALARGAEGLRVGVVTEGFGHPNSDPGVDDAVRAAVDVLRGAGLTAEDVSIPWHLHGAESGT